MTRHFSAEYAEDVALRDGTIVRLRLVAPDDKERLRVGFEQLSPESRYARFLGAKDSLSDDELRYLTEIDQESHFAIGALLEDGTGAGLARFVRLAEPPETAEAAIAVADAVHGRGLGKLLFLRLCAAAAERGIARFRCEVLDSNTAMHGLIEDLAPDAAISASSGVVSIEMAIPEVPPTESVAGPPPPGPMYGLFRKAAENAIDWSSAVRRLWRRD